MFLKKYKKIKLILQLHRHNKHGAGNINSEIDDDNENYINIDYVDRNNENLEKINTNVADISSNLGKINDNKDDIIALQTSNVKAFYNLDKIFIYNIEKGNQIVDKDNYFHIFEKEIYYNFVKNSYLEIILKVLTEISNYVSIGFFQILCNFYDQNDNLFYNISLSTAMGSINKLSTITSVFIVPINQHMTKIKIDFFIKPSQENRSARFDIHDINSNKIYIKYFQKTDEMSIKNIQDNLNSVNNISSNLSQISTNKGNISSNLRKINNITKTIMLKNIYFTDFDSKKDDAIVRELLRFDIGIDRDRLTSLHKAFMKYYFKKDDIIEIDCKLLLSHSTYEYANFISIFYGLYEGTEVDHTKLMFREIRRYNQFPLVASKNRVIAHTKLCYEVEYDMDDILFFIQIGAPNQKK